MNQFVVSSESIRSSFEIDVVPLQFASSIGDIGRPAWSKAMKAAKTGITIARVCLARRPVLAYFTLSPTGFAFWRDLAYVAILKAFGVPIAFHLHGKGLAKGQASTVQRFCYRWAFRGETLIILAPRLYLEIEDIVPMSACRFVPNGVPDLLDVNATCQRSRPVSGLRILFLSNMLREKGIYDLATAAQTLWDSGVRVEITFVGPFLSDRVQSDFLSHIRANQLEQIISWVGPAYGECRLRHLLDADLFVFPSYYGPEAFPLVLLEAMAAGLPVIATDTGAIPEIVDHGKTGLVVPAKDPAALAAAIRALVEDPTARIAMGIQGRLKYEREYRLERFLERMRSLLIDLTHSGGDPPSSGGLGSAGGDTMHAEELAHRTRVG